MNIEYLDVCGWAGGQPLNSTWQDVAMFHPFNCTSQNILMELKYISMCMDIWKLGIYKKERKMKKKKGK